LVVAWSRDLSAALLLVAAQKRQVLQVEVAVVVKNAEYSHDDCSNSSCAGSKYGDYLAVDKRRSVVVGAMLVADMIQLEGTAGTVEEDSYVMQ
jgi:hypothetical protein